MNTEKKYYKEKLEALEFTDKDGNALGENQVYLDLLEDVADTEEEKRAVAEECAVLAEEFTKKMFQSLEAQNVASAIALEIRGKFKKSVL